MEPTTPPETPYHRPKGYAEHYRDKRFVVGSGRRTNQREQRVLGTLLALVEAAATTAPAARQNRWLDVPSGTGRLGGLLPGGAPVHCDRSISMLHATATERLRVCASAHCLPFRDGAFAGVLCMRLLHHIADQTERRWILSELRRVSSGPLIVSFFHSYSVQHARRVLARLLGKRHSGRCAVRYAVFRRDLEAAGYEIVVARPLARFISEQWLVLAR